MANNDNDAIREHLREQQQAIDKAPSSSPSSLTYVARRQHQQPLPSTMQDALEAFNAEARLQQHQTSLQLLLQAQQPSAQIIAPQILYPTQLNALGMLSALQGQAQTAQTVAASPAAAQKIAAALKLAAPAPQAPLHPELVAPLLNISQQQSPQQQLLSALLGDIQAATPAAVSLHPAAATAAFAPVGLQDFNSLVLGSVAATQPCHSNQADPSQANAPLGSTCNEILSHMHTPLDANPKKRQAPQFEERAPAFPQAAASLRTDAGSRAAKATCSSVSTKISLISDADDAWNEGYLALCEFRKMHGHANVPAKHSPDQRLGHWVMAQRRQYQLLQRGKPSSLTPERMESLDALGIVWSIRSDPEEMWNLRVGELEAFKARHGHCLVPQRCAEEPQLGTWVNTQRRHYKLMKDGKPTSMTPSRVERLESIGFAWETTRGAPRGKRKRKS